MGIDGRKVQLVLHVFLDPELGLEILERNLEETNFSNAFDARRVFELLKEGETDKALELISESQPTPQKSEQ